MHRSQILLEEWQYEFLRDISSREETSISQIVRELVSSWIESRRAETWESDPFFDIIGMASGDGCPASLDHDHYLYVPDWRNREDERP
jgi:hypothetical protein